MQLFHTCLIHMCHSPWFIEKIAAISIDIFHYCCHNYITNISVFAGETRHRASTSTRWHFAFAICCHSNATHAPITNPPNSAQLGGTPTIPASYIRVHAVVWSCSHGQTDTDTQTRVTNIHLALSTTHVKCNQWRNRSRFHQMCETGFNFNKSIVA